MKNYKKILSIIFIALFLFFIMERLYNYFYSEDCKNDLSETIFIDDEFRKDRGLPIFDSKNYEEKIQNRGTKIVLYNDSNKYPFLIEETYFCYTNSVKDLYLISDSLSIECRLYFSEPINSRFFKIEDNTRKIISFKEAYKILRDAGLDNSESSFFYGIKIKDNVIE